jgi:hypothetical protein
MYRGQMVATKYFKPHTKVTDVEHEVEMIWWWWDLIIQVIYAPTCTHTCKLSDNLL